MIFIRERWYDKTDTWDCNLSYVGYMESREDEQGYDAEFAPLASAGKMEENRHVFIIAIKRRR